MLLPARYSVHLGVGTVRYAVLLSLASHGIFDDLDVPQTNGPSFPYKQSGLLHILLRRNISSATTRYVVASLSSTVELNLSTMLSDRRSTCYRR
jgi:hypothetical protein